MSEISTSEPNCDETVDADIPSEGMVFPSRLQMARGAMLQKEFAKLIGVTDAAIRRYESGKKTPSLSTFLKIIEVTGLDATWLLGIPQKTDGLVDPASLIEASTSKYKQEIERKDEQILTLMEKITKIKQKDDDKIKEFDDLSETVKKLKKEAMTIQCKWCNSRFNIAVNERYSDHKCPKCENTNFTEVKITRSAWWADAGQAGGQRYDKMQVESVSSKDFTPQENDFYFDIETTGFSYDDHATIICWLQNGIFNYWANERNGCGVPNNFIEAYNNATRVVTFSGNKFDIPRIVRWFNLQPPRVHLDVQDVAMSSGVTGKLKEIEENYGVSRPETIKGMVGIDAANFWKKYVQTNNEILKQTIINYCLHDVFSTYAVHLGVLGIPVDPLVYQNLLTTNAKAMEA